MPWGRDRLNVKFGPRVFVWGAVLGYGLVVLAALARLPVLLDEAYYWTWAQDLSWSYFDHPPGVAAVLSVFTAVLGDGHGGLRGASGLAMGGTMVLVVLATRRLDARKDAGELAFWSMAGALAFTIGYLPATPDPFQGVTLALTGYLTVRTLEPDASFVWPLSLGFMLMTGGLVKHSSLLVSAGAGLAALWHPAVRPVLRRPALWLGLGAGLGLLIPWGLAELANGGATEFQFHRVVHGKPPRGLVAVPLVIGVLAGLLGPGTTWALGRSVVRAVRRSGPPAAAVLGGGAAFVVAGCLAATWMGSGEVHWVTPALIIGVPAAVAAMPSEHWHLYRRIAMVTTLLGIVGLLHITHPFLPVPPEKDRTRRAEDYDRLAKIAGDLAKRHDAAGLVTRRYQAASQLRYHLSDRYPVFVLRSSRKSQYDRWPRPELAAGTVAIVVLRPADRAEAWPDVAPLETMTVKRWAGADVWRVDAVRVPSGGL